MARALTLTRVLGWEQWSVCAHCLLLDWGVCLCLRRMVSALEQAEDSDDPKATIIELILVEEALLALDPWNSGRINASDAYAALTPGLESEEKEKAAEEVGGNQGEHNRGVLGGGVGHAKERFFS